MTKKAISKLGLVVSLAALVAGCSELFGPSFAPSVPVDRHIEVAPNTGMIYVVDFEITNSKIGIVFKDHYYGSVAGSDPASAKSSFDKALKTVITTRTQPAGWFRGTGLKSCKFANSIVMRGGKGLYCVEPDTSVSAANKSLSFVAFVLNPEITNWKFVTEDKSSKPTHDDHVLQRYEHSGDYYSNLYKMNINGVSIKGGYRAKDVVAAYFISDGVKASGDGKNHYVSYFNLYTEFHSEGGGGKEDATSIPIIIDPDVRWPGGQGGG